MVPNKIFGIFAQIIRLVSIKLRKLFLKLLGLIWTWKRHFWILFIYLNLASDFRFFKLIISNTLVYFVWRNGFTCFLLVQTKQWNTSRNNTLPLKIELKKNYSLKKTQKRHHYFWKSFITFDSKTLNFKLIFLNFPYCKFY